VTVSLYGRQATATADAAGRWTTVLPAMAAGGPYTLEARAAWGGSPLCNLSDGSGLPVGPFEISIK
jgi:hypothetical protein